MFRIVHAPLATKSNYVSVEAVLTVATLLLAVLALIPRERAQDLCIRLGSVAVVVAGLAGALVIYWALLEEIHSLPGLSALQRPVPWWRNWTPASVSLLVLLLAAAVAWWSYSRQLPVARIPRLARTIADTLARRRLDECLHLIDTHFRSIRKALDGDYWQERLRLRLWPTLGELFIRAQRRSPELGGKTVSANNVVVVEGPSAPSESLEAYKPRFTFQPSTKRGALARWFSVYAEKPREAAEYVVRLLGLAPAFVNELAAVNPYLGLRLLDLRSTWMVRDFAESYARALLGDAESALYRELRRAQNIGSNGVVFIDRDDQPLLSSLCDDVNRPDGPVLIYTFLEAGIEPLRWEQRSALRDLLNAPIADFQERGRWTCPPFATIYLLQIVAPRIALNPDARGLNLYVVKTLVEVVLHQLKPDTDVEPWREWPTPSHYLVYECVSLMRDLVKIMQQPASDEGEPSVAKSNKLSEHAIDVLGAVMYVCLSSDRLDGRFKGYLLEVWWDAYSDQYAGDWARSGDVLAALVRGGRLAGGEMAHRSGLADAMEHIDTMIKVSKAADVVREQFGLPVRR